MKKYTDKEIFSYVLERDEVFEKYNNKVSEKNKNHLIYKNYIDKFEIKDFLIVYFGSSLQYLENYEEIKNKIFKNNVKYVLIFDTILILLIMIFIVCR